MRKCFQCPRSVDGGRRYTRLRRGFDGAAISLLLSVPDVQSGRGRAENVLRMYDVVISCNSARYYDSQLLPVFKLFVEVIEMWRAGNSGDQGSDGLLTGKRSERQGGINE